MGKPESGPPSGQSVEQLLTTIRQAIEADGNAVPAASPQPAPGAAAAAPLRVSVKPAAGQAPPAPPAPGPLAPGPDDEKPPAEPRDARRGPGYLSANPYRFRYSLEGSPTYMNLRNRLTSLGQRARADSQRSMASLLGGDARREEARAHAAVQPEPPQPQAELRRSLGDAEDRVDEFVAAELASGTVSYSPDYHEWSLDQSLDAYEFHRSDAAGADDLQQAEPPQPEPAYVEPEPEPAPAPVYEPEPAPEPELVYHEPEAEPAPEPEPDPEPEAQPQAQPAALQDGAQLQLEGMIRQIIEPELYRWFDEHLPDHVARAMPDEAAFIAMIRPLIEEWLADNLAGIVEDAVRDEIARITGLKPR